MEGNEVNLTPSAEATVVDAPVVENVTVDAPETPKVVVQSQADYFASAFQYQPPTPEPVVPQEAVTGVATTAAAPATENMAAYSGSSARVREWSRSDGVSAESQAAPAWSPVGTAESQATPTWSPEETATSTQDVSATVASTASATQFTVQNSGGYAGDSYGQGTYDGGFYGQSYGRDNYAQGSYAGSYDANSYNQGGYGGTTYDQTSGYAQQGYAQTSGYAQQNYAPQGFAQPAQTPYVRDPFASGTGYGGGYDYGANNYNAMSINSSEYSTPDYNPQSLYANDPFASYYDDDELPPRRSNGLAIAALVLGIVSIVTICSRTGMVPGIIAIVLGARGAEQCDNKAMARTGMILGIGGTLAGIISIVAFVLQMTTSIMDYWP